MKQITIKTIDGDALVDATVYGDWAVHRSYKSWTITHVPTGYSAFRQTKTKKAAVILVKRLNATGLDFNRTKTDMQTNATIQDIIVPIYKAWEMEFFL